MRHKGSGVSVAVSVGRTIWFERNERRRNFAREASGVALLLRIVVSYAYNPVGTSGGGRFATGAG